MRSDRDRQLPKPSRLGLRIRIFLPAVIQPGCRNGSTSGPSWDGSAPMSREAAGIARQNTFLTAEWRNLLMLNYEVDPGLLLSRVPAGTELDSFSGRTFVSLIGFEFNNTRVMGMPIPFHRSFLEVN